MKVLLVEDDELVRTVLAEISTTPVMMSLIRAIQLTLWVYPYRSVPRTC